LLKYSQNTTGVYFFLPHPVYDVQILIYVGLWSDRACQRWHPLSRI